MPMNPTRDPDGDVDRDPHRQTPQEAPGSTPIPHPARFLHYVLYAFLCALSIGVTQPFFDVLSTPTSASNPPAHSTTSPHEGSTAPTGATGTTPSPGASGATSPTDNPNPSTSIPVTATGTGEATAQGPSLSFSRLYSLPLLLLMALSAGLLVATIWLFTTPKAIPGKRVIGLAAAAGSILSASGISGALLKEAKIESIFKFDKLDLNLSWGKGKDGNPAPNPLFSLNARPIGAISPFIEGGTIPDPKEISPSQLEEVFKQIIKAVDDPSVALVILVGSADKQPLHGNLRTQFDSNVGLAQARAEWVKTEIIRRDPQAKIRPSFLLLASGPLRTGPRMSAKEWKDDRTVEAWAFSGATTAK